MRHINRFRFLTPIILLIGFTNFCLGQVNSTSGYLLREGVVVNTVRNEIYITTPNNKTEALLINSGQSLWRTADDAKPLVVINGKLFTQGKGSSQPSRLFILELDLAQKGKVSKSNAVDLPDTVKSDFKQSAKNSFIIQAVESGGEPFFSWRFHSIPLRGMFEQDSINQQFYKPVELNGFFKIQKTNRNLIKISGNQFPNQSFHRSILVDQRSKISDVKTQQFISKDEKYIMTSEQVSDAAEFNNYRWIIYEKSSGKKVGELFDYRSYAPFGIIGNILIYESGPYIRKTGNEIKETPLRIIAFNLVTKTEVWSKEILDTIERGPFPPEND